ncbi:MAG: GntR family transcriptional regulator [Ilumatobacter sp.]|uniref:GntR family transcriptional regulator n=1 Tax=Ilumatobacter sp. TaxID=1967498 RepID=UPI00261B7F4E|nr:GntR family transcriptional regulator [Ilumatobacter sp.]MDJ0770942.1 GntR family transcriptional regulator [Ilumatobacter sp.]
MPLWAQLEAELKRRLDAGDFDDGAFPTDLELTEDYEVSRHTVREAIRHLNRTGLLRRERGRGTVINRSEFEQSLGALYSLFESVESRGVEQTSEVLELAVVREPTAAEHLELPPDSDLVLVARLRMAGGEPLAIDRAWLPYDVAAPLLDVDWTRTALYDELRRAGAPVPNLGWERLTPVVPSAADRRLLDLDRGEAAFSLERRGCRDGLPIEWRTTLIRGDRYRFVADWSAGSLNPLRPDVADA